jgi:hypothetical protein
MMKKIGCLRHLILRKLRKVKQRDKIKVWVEVE